MPGKRIDNMQQSLFSHFSDDIWTHKVQDDSPLKRRLYVFSRWIYLLFSGFFVNQSLVRAAALTFATVLSIVPFLAVAFSISKGFGLQNTDFIRSMLMRIMAGREEVVGYILQYIDRTNVQTLGWIGVATLLITVFSMVGTVEKAFNNIWAVKKGRTAWRKFTDFFSVILVCPLVVVVASSFTVTIRKQQLVQNLLEQTTLNYAESLVLKIAPLLMIWFAFTFLYIFIPNTRVRLSAAAVGGIVGGSLWQLAQWVYIGWQIGVVKYNAIYGSFAQLPLFLMWLYISWAIVLLGAEASHAAQNVNTAARRRFLGNASLRERQKTAIMLYFLLSRRFLNGEPPSTAASIAQELDIAPEFCTHILSELAERRLVVETNDQVPRYSPSSTPGRVTLLDLARSMYEEAEEGKARLLGDRFPEVDAALEQIELAARRCPANSTMDGFALAGMHWPNGREVHGSVGQSPNAPQGSQKPGDSDDDASSDSQDIDEHEDR